MDWKNHFKTVFFDTWLKAGLPHYQDHLRVYYGLLNENKFTPGVFTIPNDLPAALTENALQSMYAFGAILGNIFSELLGLQDNLAKTSSDWCGRFNLGISLFDYITDETDGGSSRVSDLKVFQPFSKATYTESHSLTPVEIVLSQLAGSVLNDLKKEGSDKTATLFKVMKKMFDAQLFISKNKLSSAAPHQKIKKALYLKSAEPFRIMAEYTAGIASPENALLISKARSIGKAIGCCYWLIDDAKDVWLDLKDGNWNIFLQKAAEEDPLVFTEKNVASSESRLLEIWEATNHAEKISRQFIKRLIQAMNSLGLSEEVKTKNLGIIGATLWQWYHC